MEFSDFLRHEEELDLLAESIVDEGLFGGTLRALGGFGGNLISQTGSGGFNLLKGAGRTARGIGRLGLGAVQGVTGGREAGSTLASGASDVAAGVGGALKGAAQAVGALSGFTPTMRAVQAANEKSFFTPMSNRRTGVQMAMGLNSWDPEGDAVKDKDEKFGQLKSMFVAAKRSGDRDAMRRIRAEMERVDPAAYKVLVAKARALKSQHERDKWAKFGASASGIEKPEDFLGRLASEQ